MRNRFSIAVDMELIEAAVHVILRFIGWIGLAHFFEWSERHIHRYLLPDFMRENIGDNSDAMHAITILFWMAVMALILFLTMITTKL